MAAKTDRYTERVSPNSGGTALIPNPRVPVLDPSGRALMRMGEIGDNVVNTMQRNDNILRQIDDRDAVSQARVRLSETELRIAEYGEQLRAETPDNPSQFTPTFAKGFDKIGAELLAETQNPVAQRVVRERLADLKTREVQQAMGWQAQQMVKYRSNQVEQITESYTRLLVKDPDQWGAVTDGVTQAIADMQLPAEHRTRFTEAATARLTEAATLGAARQNPRLMQKFINARLGIEEPKPEPAPTTAPADLDAEGRALWEKAPPNERAALAVAWRDKMAGRVTAGKNLAYTPAEWAARMAEGVKESPDITVNVEHKARIPFLDKLDARQLVTLKSQVDTMVNQDRAMAQSDLRAFYHNAGEQAQRGVVPALPPAILVQRAVGVEGAAEEMAKFGTLQKQAAAMSQVQGLTVAQMQQQAANLAPLNRDDPEWTAKTKAMEHFQGAAKAALEARQKDPIAAASVQRIAQINPLDFSQPTVIAELANRNAVAVRMATEYGGAGFSAMTKEEAKAYGEDFHRQTTSQQITTLAALRSGLTDPRVYRDTVRAFADDSPIMLAAADLATRTSGRAPDGALPNQVAFAIIEGERMLNPDKFARKEDGKGKAFTLPKTAGPDGMDARIADTLGQAFLQDAEGYARAKQAIYAHYAYQSAQAGAFAEQVYDRARLDNAIDSVVGARSKWAAGWFGFGGQPVIMPWGMREEEFRPQLLNAYDRAMTAAGLKGSALDKPSGTELVRLSEYRYGLRMGMATIKAPNGMPVVLDITPTDARP